MDSAVVLELTRGHDAHRSEVALRDETEYLLRWGNGTYVSARFPWSRVPPADMQAVLRGGASAQARQRVGDALRAFLEPLGWNRLEAEVLRRTEKEEVSFVIRCNAGELRRLPLELVTLEPSGEALGQRRGCHVQWEWPGTETAPRELPAPPEGGTSGTSGTLMFAWSAAGGPLDAAGHLRAVQRAAKARGHGGKVEQIGQASIERLRQALDAARARGEAVSVLHLLCHGGPLPEPESGYGLWLEDPGDGARLVDPLSLAEALAPYAGLVGCVVLCACHGANLADRDNVLGSAAQRLHRVGFPAVVASRTTVSGAGAEGFATGFYEALLAGEPLHRAVAAGRRRLGAEWAGLQLFARAKDGPQYPLSGAEARGPAGGAVTPEGRERGVLAGTRARLAMAMASGALVAALAWMASHRGDPVLSLMPERPEADGGQVAAPESRPEPGLEPARELEERPPSNMTVINGDVVQNVGTGGTGVIGQQNNAGVQPERK